MSYINTSLSYTLLPFEYYYNKNNISNKRKIVDVDRSRHIQITPYFDTGIYYCICNCNKVRPCIFDTNNICLAKDIDNVYRNIVSGRYLLT